jgi:hypothetical protein
MHTCRAFALPFVLVAVAAVAGGLFVGTARTQRSTTIYCGKATGEQMAQAMLLYTEGDGTWESLAVPRSRIPIADRRAVTLRELPGEAVKNEELAGTQWRYVNLRGVTFVNVDLRRANLEGADLRGATFAETDLRDANLAGADLTGVYFDRFTRWPAGFDPTAHGAVLDD